MPQIARLDHLVLTATDIARTRAFYRDALGMEPQVFQAPDGPRHALAFAGMKINLHQAGAEFDPKAAHPRPGSLDLCFLSETPLEEWMAHLAAQGIPIEEGPVARTGAAFALVSIYLRDPDGNLIELSNKA